MNIFDLFLLLSLLFLAASLLELCATCVRWGLRPPVSWVLVFAGLSGACFTLAYFGHLIVRLIGGFS